MTKNLLRLLRGNRTQSEMAQAYGVSQPCWHSWENGRTVPDAPLMLRLERDFDLPMEVIFFAAFNNKNQSNVEGSK